MSSSKNVTNKEDAKDDVPEKEWAIPYTIVAYFPKSLAHIVGTIVK